MKRLDGQSRSPIYASFSETLNGLATIRAFMFVPHFQDIHDSKIDTSSRVLFVAKTLERWLAVRLEFIGNLVVLTVAVVSVLMQDSISPAMIGVCLVL